MCVCARAHAHARAHARVHAPLGNPCRLLTSIFVRAGVCVGVGHSPQTGGTRQYVSACVCPCARSRLWVGMGGHDRGSNSKQKVARGDDGGAGGDGVAVVVAGGEGRVGSVLSGRSASVVVVIDVSLGVHEAPCLSCRARSHSRFVAYPRRGWSSKVHMKGRYPCLHSKLHRRRRGFAWACGLFSKGPCEMATRPHSKHAPAFGPIAGTLAPDLRSGRTRRRC